MSGQGPSRDGRGVGAGDAFSGALAVVIARAGSKGVPGKNHADIGGRPCCEWTMLHAIASRRVGRVVVSTDCPRVAASARSLGVGVIDRPATLASDTATVDDAARHAVQHVERAVLGVAMADDAPMVLLYANVPVRPADLIDRAVERLVGSGADSVQSYTRVGKNHPWWMVRLNEGDGAVRPWEGEVLNHGVYRRQDLPPAYVPDGGVIALTRRSLMLGIAGVPPGPHAFLGRDRRGIATDEGAVIDIDSPLDVVVADALLRRGGAGR